MSAPRRGWRRCRQVIGEHEVFDGYDAAKALRPASGPVELVVRRRRPTTNDLHATRMQSAWRGTAARFQLHLARGASTTIACAWRRCAARDELERRRCASGAHAAVTAIQSAWRRYDACDIAYERRLALSFLQEQVREWLAARKWHRSRLAAGLGEVADTGATRKRRRACGGSPIRAPPSLVVDDDE